MSNVLKIIIAVVLIVSGLILYFVMQNNNKRDIKIAFFGDSITEYGWTLDNGYVKLTVEGLNQKGRKVIPIPLGVAGNTSNDLLSRTDSDVISNNPDVVVLMCGLNDIRFRQNMFDEYKNNMTTVIKKLKENNIKVVLLNLTIYEGDYAFMDSKIDEYNSFLNDISKKENIIFVDVRSKLKKAVLNSSLKQQHVLTVDGVHLNYKGNKILADTLIPVLNHI